MAVVAVVAAFVFARYDLAHWTFVAAVRQLVGFAQNVNIVQLVRVAWPDIYEQLMTVFSLLSFDLDVTAPECYAENMTWHTRFYGWLVLFGTACVLLAVLAVAAGGRARGKLKRLLVLLFTAAYASIATQCARSFQATKATPPTFVYDTRIAFDSAAHAAVMAVAGTWGSRASACCAAASRSSRAAAREPRCAGSGADRPLARLPRARRLVGAVRAAADHLQRKKATRRHV